MRTITSKDVDIVIAEGLNAVYVFKVVPAPAVFSLAAELEKVAVPEPPSDGDEKEWRKYEREVEEYVEQLQTVLMNKLESIAEIVIVPKVANEVKIFRAHEVTTAPTAKWHKDTVVELIEYIKRVEL